MHTERDILRVVEVASKKKDSNITWTISFRDELCSQAEPGQFIMIWVPLENEIPMSLSEIKSSLASITVKPVGRATERISKIKRGEKIWIRGPYGRGFTARAGRSLLIGGGTGLAPLIPLAAKLLGSGGEATLIMAGQSKNTIPLTTKAKSLQQKGLNILYATEDGTLGVKGSAIDSLQSLLKERYFDRIYTCGPEPMMKKVYQIARAHRLHLEASLERYMKCGIGICGSCTIGKYLVCRDGPVFDEETLTEVQREFGRVKRSPSGLFERIG